MCAEASSLPFGTASTDPVCDETSIHPACDLCLQVLPSAEKQTVTGFGASACWWSQMVADDATRTDILKKLYSREGLGLTIYRYNVGGGVNPAHNRVRNPWRNTESFYVRNAATGAWEFDFTRDANAQKALFEALSYGCVDTVVLFANSPHYSMTVSGEASGGAEKAQSNLAEAHRQAFVDYFLTITEYFLSRGVPVKYISPLNEPQWNWGGADVRQEGCHYEPAEVAALLHLFAVGIEARGLPVKLSAPESGELGDATRRYFSDIAADEVILRNTASFSYHSYWCDERPREKQTFGDWFHAQTFGDRTLDMTEWCELPCRHAVTDPMAAAIMARVIANDLQCSGVNSWTAWVAVNQQGKDAEGLDFSDGLFSAAMDFSAYTESYRYCALGHFSKFIPAGSVAVDYTLSPLRQEQNKAPETGVPPLNCAAFKTPRKKLVLVVANEGDGVRLRLDPACTGKAEIYTTDETHRLAQTYTGRTPGVVTLPAVSVTTIVLSPMLQATCAARPETTSPIEN